MDSSEANQPGHAPIYSKKRKTATRSKKTRNARPGGVSTLINMFEPVAGASKTQEDKSRGTAKASSSYAISGHGEKTDLSEGLAIRSVGASSIPGTAGDEKAMSKDRGSQDDTSEQGLPTGKSDGSVISGDDHDATEKNDMEKPKIKAEYSAEARTYHAYYDELQRAHLRGHYTWCVEHCKALLIEPRIPLWTRIQTLQLLSTMLQPAGAEQCLEEADQVLDILDPDQFQTQLLREDNRKMKADRMVWRIKKHLVGKDIDGIGEDAQAGPSDAYLALDRELEDKLEREREEEMVPSRKPDVQMADAGKGEVANVPSPPLSDA